MLIIIINESLMADLILPFLMLSAFLLIKVGINFQHLCARIAISFVCLQLGYGCVILNSTCVRDLYYFDQGVRLMMTGQPTIAQQIKIRTVGNNCLCWYNITFLFT